LVIRHRQLTVQVEVLHEKMIGQGSQSAMQLARSSAQFKLQGHAVGHDVVTPSQVTCPRSPTLQLPSAAEQLVTLLLPLQLTVPPFQQVAVALQRDFSPMAGRLAASTGAGAPGTTASAAMKA
jgi:hypothetical protein